MKIMALIKISHEQKFNQDENWKSCLGTWREEKSVDVPRNNRSSLSSTRSHFSKNNPNMKQDLPSAV